MDLGKVKDVWIGVRRGEACGVASSTHLLDWIRHNATSDINIIVILYPRPERFPSFMHIQWNPAEAFFPLTILLVLKKSFCTRGRLKNYAKQAYAPQPPPSQLGSVCQNRMAWCAPWNQSLKAEEADIILRRLYFKYWLCVYLKIVILFGVE